MFDYNRIALFVRVVRTGSFTAAAAEVGLPKSSVSRNVSQLEQDLGVRLLQRTSRKLALTDVGKTYYDTVSGTVDVLDEAYEAAREHSTAPKGVVRIAAPPDSEVVSAAVVELKKKYPGIRFEVSLSSLHVDLVGGGFDLAVRAGRLEDSSLIARRIGTTSLGLVAAPSYLRARGTPTSLEELASHEWVLYRAMGGRSSIKLNGPEGKRTVEVSGTLVADDIAFCRAAVEAGAGIALLPLLSVAESLANGTLEQVLPEWTNQGSALFVVLPTTRHLPVRVQLVRDFLIEFLTQRLADLEGRCKEAARQSAAPLKKR